MKQRYDRLDLHLKSRDRQKVSSKLRQGVESARVLTRARILQLLDSGESTERTAELLQVSATTVRRIGWRYVEEGLDAALSEQPRPGQPRALTTQQAQRIIALVCSAPPEGYARWSVRLIAEQARKRRIVKSVGRETIRILLKSHDLKPWREKNVVHRRAR